MKEPVEPAAAEAFAALRNPDTPPALLREIEARRATEPEFDQAMTALESVWSDLGELAQRPAVRAAGGRRRPAHGNGRDGRDRSFAPRWLAGLAAALIVLLSAGIYIARDFATSASGPVHAQTGVGEQRLLTLADGSTVVLNSDSELRFTYGGPERIAEVARGQLLFTVESGLSPFIVRAGEIETRVLGTVFEVTNDEDYVAVTVAEGQVSVRRRTGAGMSERRIGRGQRIWFAEDTGATGSIGHIPVQSISSWREGIMEFDSTPLPDALRQASRYIESVIVPGDEGVRSLRISGSFRIDDIEFFIDTLEQTLPVKLVEEEDGRLVLRASGD